MEEGVRLRTYTPEAPGSRSIAPLKKTFHFAAKFRYRGIEGFAPGIDDYGPLWAQPFQVKTDSLSDTPANAISHHRRPNRAGNGKSDADAAILRLTDAKSREERD